MLLVTVRLAALYFSSLKRARGHTQPFTPYENANDKSYHWLIDLILDAWEMTGMQYSCKVSAKAFITVRQAEDRARFHGRGTWSCKPRHLFVYLLMHLLWDIVEIVLNITCLHPAESHMLVYTLKLTQTHQQKERERKTGCQISTAGCVLPFISFLKQFWNFSFQ